MADPAAIAKLVLGTAGLGMPYGLPGADGRPPQPVGEDRAAAVIARAVAIGIRAFDTAPAYGVAEERLGRYLGPVGTVWTKLAHGQLPTCSLDDSLRRLGRARIDLVQWHNWSPGAVAEADWQALARDPRVGALGCSTYGPDDARAGVACGRFAVVQVEWNLLDQRVLDALVDVSGAQPLTVPGRPRTRIAVRSVWLQGVLHDRLLPAHLAPLGPARERARRFADGLGLPLPVLALRAALDHPLVHHVLIGADHPDQFAVVEAALAAPPLPVEVRARLASLHAASPLTDPRTWSRP